MAKPQPKVSDLVEILLQQVHSLQNSVDQNNKIQLYLSNKIDNTIIKVDTTDLDRIQENYSNKINTDLKNYLNQFEKNNNELLKTSKYFSSKKIVYLIGLNVFLVLFTAISMYTAMSNIVAKSDYENLSEESKIMQSQIENVKYFFQENPKTAKLYKKWNKNNQK